MRFIALSLAAAISFMPSAHAAVTLKIKNFSGQQVWVMWTGTSSLAGTSNGISIASSDYNVNAAGYDLSTFKSTATNEYQIDNFSMGGGRMWFTFGANSWTFHNAGYTPALATFNDQNFALRYDKIEASITGSTADTVDMTALDGFSIPFTVTGYQAANKATTTQTLNGALGNTIAKVLGAVAANSNAAAPTTPASSSPALQQISGNSPYLVINTNSQGITPPTSPYVNYQYSPIGQTGSFVRVIANDNTVAPYGGDPVAAANSNAAPANYAWMTYENYLKLMDGRATTPYTGTTAIAGSFVGVSGVSSALTAASTYSLTATFNPNEVSTVAYPVSGASPVIINFTGWVTLSGTVTIPTGTYAGTYTTVIKIPYGGLPQYYSMVQGTYPGAFMLDPSGVVGANANYLYKFYKQGTTDPGVMQTNPFNGGPQNNVLTQIEGDLFAGMNVGSLGSVTPLTNQLVINGNTYPVGTLVGSMNSQDWFSLGTAMVAATGTGGVYDYYFGYLQPSSQYYNKYAEALYPLSDAYGFAYSDRIQGGRVAISWDATKSTAIDTIVITILPDAGTPLLSSAPTVDAVEYYSEALGDYFVTWIPGEVAKLDSGATRGWARTGRSFKTYATPQAGTTPVCRFYLPPKFGDSHFLGRNAAECGSTAANFPGFVLEDAAFMHMFMPVAGVCPASTTPVYRLYSNRADTNHRYVADARIRTQMQVRGWLAEGDGNDRVAMCAPM